MATGNELVGSLKDSKNTSLPSIITGFEAVAILIPDKTIKTVITVASPFLAWVFTVFFKSIIHHIESKRGIKVIEEAIEDTNYQLNQNLSSTNKKKLEADIEKLRTDLIEAKKAAIKIMVF
ncbi:MAG: hypothetical protein EOP43_07115 [Sphingobacteriaceae bacterium]|nr:MAG: hypothetical protein EOP43_07115 [Sphingobacteriaceae bacterium]